MNHLKVQDYQVTGLGSEATKCLKLSSTVTEAYIECNNIMARDHMLSI